MSHSSPDINIFVDTFEQLKIEWATEASSQAFYIYTNTQNTEAQVFAGLWTKNAIIMFIEILIT